MEANVAVTWKVRPTPSRPIRRGDSPVYGVAEGAARVRVQLRVDFGDLVLQRGLPGREGGLTGLQCAQAHHHARPAGHTGPLGLAAPVVNQIHQAADQAPQAAAVAAHAGDHGAHRGEDPDDRADALEQLAHWLMPRCARYRRRTASP